MHNPSSIARTRLKMSDIAALAGVSVSTVSRALSGSSLVPQSVREKIEKIARDNEYAVNHTARNLRTQTTRTIGIVLPLGHETGQQITDPFFMEMIGHLSQRVIERSYDILLTKIAAPNQGWLSNFIQSHRVDGLLILGQSDQHEVINEVSKRYLPMVVWGEQIAGQTYCSVGLDNVYSGIIATEHLIALGRTHIRFVGPSRVPETKARYLGYCQAMNEAGLKPLPLIESHFTFDFARETARELMRSKTKFDALFCASDVIAHGALKAASECGLNIPEDVAICGFDDVPFASALTPSLTTIRQDLDFASRIMVDLLFKRLAGEDAPSNTIPARLMIRASTQA